MNSLLSEIEAFLAKTERKIALIDRCRPRNQSRALSEVRQAWARGEPQNPQWEYRPPPDLGDLREKLEVITLALESGDDLAQLYAERARELCLEAELAEAVGTPRFRDLATRRYQLSFDEGVCHSRARVWATLEQPTLDAARWRSDDATQPESLLSLMQRGVRELALPYGVVVRDDLTSAAAITEELVFIQAGLEFTEREARRIVVHELHGHALPRVRARREPLGLFRVGSARGADEEEGRALLMERRHGLFSIERQIELGRRHLASWAVAEGADWVETVRSLSSLGADPESAMSVASRVHRGGGLGRERVYLPALLYAESVLEEDPDLEVWLARGRLSVRAARVVRASGFVRPQATLAALERSAFELYE